MSESSMTRRGLMRRGGLTAAGATALAATGTASAQSDYDGWLSNTGNYDGTTVDETGSDSVTIEVGADGNSGPFAFAPAAVKVTPGTTITWEWVSGNHNVVDDGDAFESELTDETGHTFEWTPEETGVFKYFCAPHKTMGMKGVVDVVSGSGGGGGGGGGASENLGETTDAMGSSGGGTGTVGNLVVGGLVLAFVSPAIFATVLRNQDLSAGEEGDR